jgi:D-alanine-D-alanine ligase
MMSKHVAVLLGGWSAEREVSLNSGKAVVGALQEAGYRVTAIDVQHDIAEVLKQVKPDVVFNALHGRFGEDGCIQGLLEILEIPYTHSGVAASALAMDKPLAKVHFAAAGIRVAQGGTFTREQVMAGDVMPRPYVIKPLNEGSSVGVSLVFEGENWDFTATPWPYGEQVLVEQYIPGREIQVAVLEDKALGAIEIVPVGRFYDYDAKYKPGQSQHLMPAPLPKHKYEEVLELALKAHQCLGCRGLTRSDFRYDNRNGDDNGTFYILEVNSQPGMTQTSLSPEIAAHAGISFKELVITLVESAKLG